MKSPIWAPWRMEYILGVKPQGCVFCATAELEPTDTTAPGGAPVVMLSYGCWKNRFGGDPGILNHQNRRPLWRARPVNHRLRHHKSLPRFQRHGPTVHVNQQLPIDNKEKLIVVVVFQNDIRRGLMRVGARAFFGGITRDQESRVIDEVVAAATELARHRMGALICFEQDANLDEFVVGQGTVIDAAVQRELLVVR